MKVKAILFGGIGTLLETSEIQRMAFNEAFDRCGLDWHWDRDAYLDMLAIPGGVQRILRYAEARGETAIDQEAAERLHADKTAHFHAAIKEGGLSARDGVEPLVSHCLNANIALGFATTTDAQTARAVLDAIGIDPAVFSVITHRDLVAAAKPDPAVYLHCLTHLGIAADEAVAIEDSESGLQSAVRAGLPCIVTPGANTLGQDYEGALAVIADLDIAQRSLSLFGELGAAHTDAA